MTALPVLAAPIGSGFSQGGPEQSGPTHQLILHVVDRTGAAVKGATVILHANGKTIRTRSGEDGVTRDLPMGTVRVMARKAGVGANHAAAGMSGTGPTEFTLSLQPHVGYSGGFHRVVGRRGIAVREAEAKHRERQHDRPAANAPAAVTPKEDEPLDTTPNKALRRLPGTRHRGRGVGPVAAGGGAAGPSSSSGIAAGGAIIGGPAKPVAKTVSNAKH